MNGDGIDMSPYSAAGELAGITSLVDVFYSNMDTFPEARVTRKMHPGETKGSGVFLVTVRAENLRGPSGFLGACPTLPS